MNDDDKARLLAHVRSKADDAWLAALLKRLEHPAALDEFFALPHDRALVDELRALAHEKRPTRQQLRLALLLLETLLTHDAAAMLANELRAQADGDAHEARARQRVAAESKRATREADLDDLARALNRLRDDKPLHAHDLDAILAAANKERRRRDPPGDKLAASRPKNLGGHAAIVERADALRLLRK